jgi:hypothetical protein
MPSRSALVALLLVGFLILVANGAVRRTGSPPKRGSIPARPTISARIIAGPSLTASDSRAVGADLPTYWIRGAADRLWASTPAQHLRVRFDRSRVSLVSSGLHVSFSSRAIGYGRSLRALGPAALQVKANEVSYVRPGMTEWYANGPRGLEQGFTIMRSPTPTTGAPLTLALALSGNARPSRDSTHEALLLSHSRHASLRYDGLWSTDASGRRLRSWIELRGRQVLLRVDARGAHYPLRIDPFIQQGPKMTPDDEVAGGAFGAQVALSADGNTALIAGQEDNVQTGAVWVFTRSGSTWSQQGPKLTGGGAVGAAGFGHSVALSADGNTALISGAGDDQHRGAVWVFTRSGTTWTQQGQKLTVSSESPEGAFGSSVALSSDGSTALIGGEDQPGRAGAAWVFTRSGSIWSQGPKLTAHDEVAPAEFGFSVALSADGSTALIGGPYEKVPWIGFGASEAGAAWVFTRTGSTWSQQGPQLTTFEEREDGWFGWSVALSADGSTALIGSPRVGNEEAENYTGAVWTFVRSGSTWSQRGPQLQPSQRPWTLFGDSVAISSDGNTAVIGAPGWNVRGAALAFERTGSTWTRLGPELLGSERLEYGPNGSEGVGGAVALSADGTTALAGGPGDNRGAGAAWGFGSSSFLTPVTPSEPVAPPAVAESASGSSGASPASTVVGQAGSLAALSARPLRPPQARIISARTGPLASGAIYARVYCVPGPQPCVGTLSVDLLKPSGASKTARRTVVLATRRLQIESGAITSVRLHLPARTSRLLRNGRPPRLEIGLAIRGTSGVSYVRISPRRRRSGGLSAP